MIKISRSKPVVTKLRLAKLEVEVQRKIRRKRRRRSSKR